MFQELFKHESRVFQEFFKSVSWVFQRCFKRVSRGFQEGFKRVSNVFHDCFMNGSNFFVCIQVIAGSRAYRGLLLDTYGIDPIHYIFVPTSSKKNCY